MLIPIGRFLALIAFLTALHPLAAYTAEGRTLPSVVQGFKGLTDFLFDDPMSKPYVMPSRPHMTDYQAIERQSKISNITENDKTISACLETLPYDHYAVMDRLGQAARVMANHSAAIQEQFAFQPFFSGLKGPKLTLMRLDLERALVRGQGSANEIYHNARIVSDPRLMACRTQRRLQWDAEIRHHIDLIDSDRSPLYRSDMIINGRAHITRHFLGSLGLRHTLSDNLDRDQDLRILDRFDPIRQAVFGFTQTMQGIDHAMISGFATPAPDLYIGGHAG